MGDGDAGVNYVMITDKAGVVHTNGCDPWEHEYQDERWTGVEGATIILLLFSGPEDGWCLNESVHIKFVETIIDTLSTSGGRKTSLV
eukprot:UN00817